MLIKKYLYPTLSLIFLSIFSCTPVELDSNTSNDKMYFDLKGLLSEHIEILEKQQVKVEKTVSNQGEEEVIEQLIQDWEKELNAFSKADLNKTVLMGSYSVEESEQEKFQVTHYIANESNLKVKKMEVWKMSNQVIKVLVEQDQSNFLFSIQRKLELNFKDSQLTNYQINETQSLFLRDQSYYKVFAQVQY